MTSRSQIIHFYTVVPNCPLLDWGAKLSTSRLRCQIVQFYTTVSNCPGAKLSTFTLRSQIVHQYGQCQIVRGAKLSLWKSSIFAIKGWVYNCGTAALWRLKGQCIMYVLYDAQPRFYLQIEFCAKVCENCKKQPVLKVFTGTTGCFCGEKSVVWRTFLYLHICHVCDVETS